MTGRVSRHQQAPIAPLTDPKTGLKFPDFFATGIASFTADGLFTGQSQEFLDLLQQMAEDADAAERE